MIRWAHAINHFKPNFDDFARRRDHLRALRIVSISGFTGIELTAGTGRWEPLGNPAQMAANFGDLGGFAAFVREAGLDGVSSWFWDPMTPYREDMLPGSDPADAASRPVLIERARWFAGALAELGGDVLVARPAVSAWQRPDLDDDDIAVLAETWNAVGDAIAESGIRLGLHFDFLSALRVGDGLRKLVAATDPGRVGLALDTGELTIAGVDPHDFFHRHADRVVLVHLKNVGAVDDIGEYTVRNAEHHVRRAGGSRAVPRWYVELDAPSPLVDSRRFVADLARRGYDGWVVVESELSPHPPTTTMLNGWQLQHVLAPAVAAEPNGEDPR
ncbi:sugar phosphate isomerase/epimerase [Microbacterium enclense]|uniref:sugar phosphate isomerase/epimerase family protein n=1 Tax=Microbacterium enclense TaxID=993073 RepID=UPI0021A27AD6|nr:sugar phosphate isomerase/epimerase [Microbacterium enclense]MCT2086871.1 sugar phosphate isomerase/epimerase [Microbacterium enclense]